ncbi:MAG: hypothetical protein IJR27_05360 [Synergistaceae bacterium]|nr:hypothetical protein [Synergistaceae bacterium]
MNAVQEEEYVALQTHDAQLSRIEALMERTLARQEAIANDVNGIKGEIREMHGEIKALDAKIDGVEKRLDAKIDGVEKRLEAKIDGVKQELNTKIDGVEKRLEAKIDGVMDAVAITNSRIDDINNKKSNNIALWAIATAVGICAFQAIVSLISLLK